MGGRIAEGGRISFIVGDLAGPERELIGRRWQWDFGALGWTVLLLDLKARLLSRSFVHPQQELRPPSAGASSTPLLAAVADGAGGSHGGAFDVVVEGDGEKQGSGEEGEDGGGVGPWVAGEGKKKGHGEAGDGEVE